MRVQEMIIKNPVFRWWLPLPRAARVQEDNRSSNIFKVGIVMLIVMIGFLIALLWCGVDHWHYLLPGVFLYVGTLYVNSRGQETLARNGMYYGTIVLIAFLSFANRRLGAEYGMIGVACFAPTIFKKRLEVWLSSGFVFSIFVFYLIYDALAPFVANPTVNYNVLSKSILVVVVLVVFFQLMLFRNSNVYFSRSLQTKNNQLQNALARQVNVEKELQSKNEELITLTEQLNWIVIQKTSELQVYLEAINVSIYSFIIDENGTFVKVNEPFIKASGYSNEEMIGKSFSLLEAGFHSEAFYREMKATLKEGKAWRGETKNRAKDGSFFWSDQVVTPIQTADESANYYLVLGLPITERKRNDEAREKTLNFLETVAYQTSHKVRGPLARIQGLVNLIQQGLIEKSELPMVTDKLKEACLEVSQTTTELVMFVNENRYSVKRDNKFL